MGQVADELDGPNKYGVFIDRDLAFAGMRWM